LQVLVYIGAVAVLLMFGIMLTRNIQGDDPLSTPSAWQLPGLIAGFGLFLLLGFAVGFQSGGPNRVTWSEMGTRPAIQSTPGPSQSPRSAAVNNMAKTVGDELLTRYVIAFEIAGLLLTAALVGAIALAHREEDEPGTKGGAKRSAGQAAAPPAGNGPPVAVGAGSELGAAPAAH
jgi:NADH-quinone oxidoreductase subunit J